MYLEVDLQAGMYLEMDLQGMYLEVDLRGMYLEVDLEVDLEA